MFGRFCAPKFKGRAFQKLHPHYHPLLAARRLEKFCEDTPIIPEVIEAHTLNFRTNFKFLQLNFWGDPETRLSGGLCAR